MAIIVEDGSGKSDSESYISVADATTYFNERNIPEWAALATDAIREAALRNATEYMVNEYRKRWQGARVYQVQALDWPRTGVVIDSWSIPSDEVPTEVARACAELALKASSDDLQADLTQGVIKEKVDVIEVEYDKNSPQTIRYKQVDSMLSPYLSGMGGSSMGLIRT